MSAAELLSPALRVALAEAIDEAAERKIAKLVAEGKLIAVEHEDPLYAELDRKLGLVAKGGR